MKKENMADPDASRVQLSELTEAGSGKTVRWLEKQIDLIRDVRVRVSAALGGADLTVSKLFELREGDTLTLDEDVESPVELLLEGKVIARGEIVVVGTKYGVRVLEIVDPGKL
jgi:flagellar motor switch protein FliN